MNLDDTFQWVLAQLQAALLAGREEQLGKLLQSVDLEKFLSQDTIAAARAQGHASMVIFLNTLAVANEVEPAQAQQWLDCYQSVTQNKPQGLVLAWSGHDVLRMTTIALGSHVPVNAGEFKKARGSAQHWLMAFELAVDFKDWGRAKAVVKAFEAQHDFATQARMARALAHRHKLYVDSTGIAKVDIDYLALADLYAYFGGLARARKLPDLVASLGTLESSALEVAGHYHRAIERLKATRPLSFEPAVFLDQARCHCKAGELPRAIALLDELLTRTLASKALQSVAPETLSLIQGDSAQEKTKKSFNVAAASKALSDFSKVAQSRSIQAFLVSGTLLGFEREGKLLDHDKDVDVGIIGWENQYELCIALQEEGSFSIFPAFLKGRDTVYMPIRHKQTGMWIDVFIYHPVGDKLVTGVDFFYGYRQSFAFTPFALEPVDFLGVPMYVPDKVDLNLTENYGNWRIPDAAYISHLESPSTVGKGALPYMLTARLTAYQALVQKKPVKLRKIAELMNEYREEPCGLALPLIEQIARYADAMDVSRGSVNSFAEVQYG